MSMPCVVGRSGFGQVLQGEGHGAVDAHPLQWPQPAAPFDSNSETSPVPIKPAARSVKSVMEPLLCEDDNAYSHKTRSL
jgi:hypothetical protein